jgi:hypothetical protein
MTVPAAPRSCVNCDALLYEWELGRWAHAPDTGVRVLRVLCPAPVPAAVADRA